MAQLHLPRHADIHLKHIGGEILWVDRGRNVCRRGVFPDVPRWNDPWQLDELLFSGELGESEISELQSLRATVPLRSLRRVQSGRRDFGDVRHLRGNI